MRRSACWGWAVWLVIVLVLTAAGCKKEQENSSSAPNVPGPVVPATQPAPATASASPPSMTPVVQVPAGDPDKLAAGDLVEVEISDLHGSNSMTSIPVHISAKGTVRLSYLDDPVALGGKSRIDAGHGVEEAYDRAGLIQHADVVVRRLMAGSGDPSQDQIRPFDLIRIAIDDLGGANTTQVWIVRASAGGQVAVPYVGAVELGGLDEAHAADAVVKAYHDAKLIQRAGVTVLKLESAPENAAHLALPDEPIYVVPDAIKWLYVQQSNPRAGGSR